ncbi:MAG TPA: rhomboid family intramembrane serine protease [Ktedonobacteraceae bacterium]|nr:rhomboid family intramembrane serine protease [Ktedonobacteraceae bacterium]
MENIYQTENAPAVPGGRQLMQMSYQAALSRYRTLRGLARISWVTWIITIGTIIFWCFTAYQSAHAAGAHTLSEVLTNIGNNAVNVQDQDNDALTNVLLLYGAKDNALILQGQYWRFITPIFLHVNLLHVGLNMFNFLILGIFIERIFGHTRLLLIYLLTGVVSIIASFYFAPQEVSVGASGAIFGLVGAYSIFVFTHRRAFRRGGIPAMLWIVIVVGINLSIGLFVPNVDNYAHVGGLISGCILGWLFTPLYKPSSTQELVDTHGLSRRWPLAILTVLGTLILAIMALFFTGRS